MDLTEIYRVWKDTAFRDKDMRRVFEREISPMKVAFLIEENAMLKAVLARDEELYPKTEAVIARDKEL